MYGLLKCMNKLNVRDILILGLMNFAFFVGAGNIIFPPFIGAQAGTNVWLAAAGFLVTGVGLPVLASVAMARSGGALSTITRPVGRIPGVLLSVLCYLCIGPLFATPRTATVSYAFAVQSLPHHGHSMWPFTVVYFLAAILVSLYPGQLLTIIGRLLAPLKTVALFLLSLAALLMPGGNFVAPAGLYVAAPFSQGIVNGYLTMDTLGALVFGLLIVNAVRSKGISSQRAITRYAAISGLIAGVCLAFIYIGLFRIGTMGGRLLPSAANGTEVLNAYVGFHYGLWGKLFLDALITVACFVTAVGLTCACGSYFSELTGCSYRLLIWLFGGVSMLVANVGLNELIKISEPVLTAIYPIFIVLIVASFIRPWLRHPDAVIAPVAVLALFFGIHDGLRTAGLVPEWLGFLQRVPLAHDGVAWLVPSAVFAAFAVFLDRLLPRLVAGGRIRG